MKLILLNNHIYLPAGNGVIVKRGDFEVEVKDKINPDEFIMTASINGEQQVFTNSFSVTEDQLNSPYLELTITLTSKLDDTTIVYTSDKQPVTRAVVLGLPPKEWYPSTMQSLLDRVAILESKTKTNFDLVYKAIKELKNKGEVL